jgi:isopentenyl diphosphate isomerase/L-lactate dehydrogenase-like FMN-dependent dehydrogenase
VRLRIVYWQLQGCLFITSDHLDPKERWTKEREKDASAKWGNNTLRPSLLFHTVDNTQPQWARILVDLSVSVEADILGAGGGESLIQ